MTATSNETKTKVRIKQPSFYKVVMINDDYTPMDFVIQILVEIFNKGADEAVSITHAIHHQGQATVGQYTREIAEQKVRETLLAAKSNKHPLVVKMEIA